MTVESVDDTKKPADAPPAKARRLTVPETLVLYSQYILITLLVLAATILRLVYGAP